VNAAVAIERRAIPGTDGRAEATEDGQVLLDGEVVRPRRRANGYADLWIPGRGMVFVHRIVCEAWHGPPPSFDAQADHENRDRTDNRAANLRWKSPAGNAANRVHAVGADHALAALTHREAEAIKRLVRDEGLACPAVARAFGVSRSTVWRAATGRTYR
jgi:hypothetical protein